MFKSKSLAFSLSLLLVLSCEKKDNIIDEAIPLVKTLQPEVYNGGGVNLKGDLVSTGMENIMETGFEVKEYGPSQLFIATGPTGRGQFNLEISQGLYSGSEYQYTAYAITENGTIVRGKPINFISKGSATPVLESVTPSVAHIGDTVLLKGAKFGAKEHLLKLNYGSNEAEVLSYTSNEIRFVVPRPVENSRKLHLMLSNTAAMDDGLLELHTPAIQSLTPNEAFFGETITIQGNHFNLLKENTKVEIGGLAAELISVSRKEIKAKVPGTLSYNDTPNIRVYSQRQWSNSFAFTLKPPKFTQAPTEVYINEAFEVKVEQTAEGKTRFYIHEYDRYADIIDDQTMQLSFHPGPYRNRYNHIWWVVDNQHYPSPNPVKISNPFYKIGRGSRDIPFNEYVAFTKNNTGYVLGNNIEDGTSAGFIYEFDESQQQWLQLFRVRNETTSSAVRPFFGHYVYSEYSQNIYGLRKGGYENDFISIDVNSGLHLELTPLPFNTYGVGFAYGNKVYFTTGTGLNELWSFHIDTNQWAYESTLPFTSYRGEYYNVIVADDYVYIANGGEGSAYSDFWRMNLNDLQWERLADNPNPVKKATIYSFNNELHVVSDVVWRYDTVSNSWTLMERDGIFTDMTRGRFDHFSHNGIPYIFDDSSSSSSTFLSLYKGDMVK